MVGERKLSKWGSKDRRVDHLCGRISSEIRRKCGWAVSREVWSYNREGTILVFNLTTFFPRDHAGEKGVLSRKPILR